VQRSHLAALAVWFAACAAQQAAVRTAMPVLSVARAPATGSVTYFIGGDSRGDRGGVLPWAFSQAKSLAQARGFIFLGDMEWSHGCGHHFEQETAKLAPIPLYPALGNHEVRWFGFFKFDGEKQQRLEDEFTRHFLTPRGVVPGPAEGNPHPIFYATDLETGSGQRDLRFIALDNVSLGGFGENQIKWLGEELRSARRRRQLIIVGMHKPFAGNCTGKHSMEEDGPTAIAESNRVLKMLAGTGDAEPAVNAVFASHDHYFARFDQPVGDKRIRTYVTGGLGAHLKHCTCDDCADVHHVLQVDVGDPAELGENALNVSLIRWHGPEARFSPGHEDEEDDEDDGETIWNMTCAQRDVGAGAATARH
jgi:hypothetical protein